MRRLLGVVLLVHGPPDGSDSARDTAANEELVVSHRENARIARFAQCAECNAPAGCACRGPSGIVRAPHAVRTKVLLGQLIVIRTDAARSAGKLRAIREIVATINQQQG